MLFSRREQSQLTPSLTQRFSDKLGQYFVTANPKEVQSKKNKKTTFDTSACYALLGEKTDNDEYRLSDLQEKLEKFIQKYQKKTGRHLEAEQIALATIKLDAKQQAETLRHRFFDEDFSNSALISQTSTSPLRLALLSDVLNISTFSDTTAKPSNTEFKACRHMLNVMLNDVSMQDIEDTCRELLKSCSEAMTERGADADSLQSDWQLKMRYSNSENSLLLKCMPIDMLRDTFQRQHKEKFGQSNPNQDILIEALEVTMHSEQEAAPESLCFTKCWMHAL